MDEFSVDDSMSRHRAHGDAAAGCWAVVRKAAVGLTLAIVCQSAIGQAMYRIKPIGNLPGGCNNPPPAAYGLNGIGLVTGQACNAHNATHAFLWKNNGTSMVDLGPPEVGSYSLPVGINASGLVGGSATDSTGTFAFESSGDGTPMTRIYDGIGGNLVGPAAINDLGQLTGYAYTSGDFAYHAFLWKSDGSRMLDLGTLGGVSSFGNAINATGQVAGYSYLPGNRNWHAFVWKNDGTPLLDVGSFGSDPSEAYLINASGQIAGETGNGNHAFFWGNDGTPLRDLGTLGAGGRNIPNGLNDAGEVVGYSGVPSTQGDVHAFFWKNDGTPMQDLGTFGGTTSQANDINASGEVTGWATLAGDAVSHAFLWSDDGTRIRDLNKLIDPTDPLKAFVTLTEGDFINDRGDILAYGTDSRTNVSVPYLLQATGLTDSVLTLTPRSLAFGDVPINSSSATQSVTVTNTSANAVAITGIALRGTAPKQFAFTDDCGQSLAGHATCTLKAQFAPSIKGAKTAYLDVNGGGGGLRSVKLTGTGT
jgi:probable HAF family extracellular repeat protein